MKLVKIALVVLFCLAVVGVMIDASEGNDGAYEAGGLMAAGCIVAFAIMNHTDRMLAKKRKDNSEDDSGKA